MSFQVHSNKCTNAAALASLTGKNTHRLSSTHAVLTLPLNMSVPSSPLRYHHELENLGQQLRCRIAIQTTRKCRNGIKNLSKSNLAKHTLCLRERVRVRESNKDNSLVVDPLIPSFSLGAKELNNAFDGPPLRLSPMCLSFVHWW